MDGIGFVKLRNVESWLKTGSLMSCSVVSGTSCSGLSHETLLNTAKDCLSSRLASVPVSKLPTVANSLSTLLDHDWELTGTGGNQSLDGFTELSSREVELVTFRRKEE